MRFVSSTPIPTENVIRRTFGSDGGDGGGGGGRGVSLVAATTRRLRRGSSGVLFRLFLFILLFYLLGIWLYDPRVWVAERRRLAGSSSVGWISRFQETVRSSHLHLQSFVRRIRGIRDIRDDMPNYALELQLGQKDRITIEGWRAKWLYQNQTQPSPPRVVEFFIYDDLPPEVNRRILEEDPDRASATHAHSTDIVLHKQLERPNFQWSLFDDLVILRRTFDSSRASLFFVPAYMTNALKLEKQKQVEGVGTENQGEVGGDENRKKQDVQEDPGLKTWRAVMRTLRVQHKDRWNGNCEDGCDHTLVFSSGSGPAMVDGYRQLFGLATASNWALNEEEEEEEEKEGEEEEEEEEVVVDRGTERWISKMPLMLVDGGLTFVDLYRDISIPYVLPSTLRCEDWQTGTPRRHLIHFRGGIGNKKVRVRLAKALEAANVTSTLQDKEKEKEGEGEGEGARKGERDRLVLFSQEKLSREEYWKELRESMFCLIPQGWTPNSRHFVEAVISGCIPVIISSRWVPSFPHLSDLFYPSSTILSSSSSSSSSSSPSPSPFMLVHAHNELKSVLPRIELLANVSVKGKEEERRQRGRGNQKPLLLGQEEEREEEEEGLLKISEEVRRMQESLKLACKHFEWPFTPDSTSSSSSSTTSLLDSSAPRKGDAVHSILEQWVLRSFTMGNRRLISILDPPTGDTK